MRRIGTAAAIGLVAAVTAGAALPGAASAQTASQTAPQAAKPDKQTLADIQADLDRVKAEVDGLKQELKPSGTSVIKLPAGSTVPDRLDAIEAELQQLTAQTEALQNRIDRVVSDGTNRISDLQFRLTEALGGDTSKIGKATPLGGGKAPPAQAGAAAGTGAGAAGTDQGSQAGPPLAVGEQGDFDAAKAAFDAGKFKRAADLYATFAQTYTGGQLTGEALFMRGEALSRLGDTANAARAYLNSFSSYPKGPKAPDALTKLGVSLGKLGQTKDACTTLGQVSVRYPSSGAVVDAAQAMQSLGCK
jgi:tol-pal system protein YbgF